MLARGRAAEAIQGNMGAFMKLKKALLAGAALLSLTEIAEAQQFNQFVGFGDSTTDTGWFANASTGIGPYDTAIAAALAAGGNAHYTGPGAGNAQILAAFFGLTANPANTPGGTNYAIGSAIDNGTPGFENLYPIYTGVPNPVTPRNSHSNQQLFGLGEWPSKSQCAVSGQQRRKRCTLCEPGLCWKSGGRRSFSSE